MVCRSDMKCSAVIFLIFSTFCACSKIPHEIVYVVGCFVNGSAEVQFEYDGEEMLYVDFQQKEIVYTVPTFLNPDPSLFFTGLSIIRDAEQNGMLCKAATEVAATMLKNIPDKEDPPDSILYSSEEVELGVENSLICFVNNFFPPSINVIWTKNGDVVSEGVSLSRYYPSDSQPLTFRQFSTLTFTPKQGDVYSCTVEHPALERPNTRIWEVDLGHPSIGLDIYCGVGLTVALLGVATGTFLITKRRFGH
ncbi:RLA class II histocompatibility antigen, DP alpha-1 chain-like [Sphaeramia orbicularis]|uniref:RLA class II histocompatibility antigen, DP alpha-1 chain-like n=1 Tax=Sphaeramia orbicularis TaxID=375764 RepID=A0A673ASN1_9TELE|nr:RLA class II histocompatibility antigen, DP alpha-1 chain-like [Sphaeramia orbicularis]